MRIFISWSKPRARAVANALHDWLKLTIQCVDPWVSTKNIDAGHTWGPEIMGALKEAEIGIIVVTPENQKSQFLQFEAGACAMSTESMTGEKAKVCPYLVDMNQGDLEQPLTQFHTKLCDREGTFELLQSVNNAAKETKGATPVGDSHLRTLFDKTWDDLNKEIQAAIALPAEVPETTKSEKELLEELVGVVRSLDGRLRSVLPATRIETWFDAITPPSTAEARMLRKLLGKTALSDMADAAITPEMARIYAQLTTRNKAAHLETEAEPDDEDED